MQNLQDLNIRNLQEINKKLTEELEAFKPTFELDYDVRNEDLFVIMKLNGKAYTETVSKAAFAYYNAEEQADELVFKFIDVFRNVIKSSVLPELIKVNQNLKLLKEKS